MRARALADRLGAYNNANTTDFHTNYMTVLPAAAAPSGAGAVPPQATRATAG